MKNRLIIIGFLLYCLGSYCQSEINISGKWMFRYAIDRQEGDSLVSAGFYRPDFEAEGFEQVEIPSCWAVQGYEEPVYNDFEGCKASEGFYLHRFHVPASFNDKRVLLHFGGVWASAEVWLNGHHVGRHDSGYTSFALDVSSELKADGFNLLAVRVRQVYPGYKTDTYDDWALGGIYRDVTLEAMPSKRWIDAVHVETRMSGEVIVRTMVTDRYKKTLPGNYSSPGTAYQLHVTLTDSKGKVAASTVTDVNAHTSNSNETICCLNLSEPRLWTAETPYLYTLDVELEEKGTITHSRRQKIGIREITTHGGILRINGQAVKLRGVNRHDEHPDVGRAVRREHWQEDLCLMKEANINYVRAAHYQHAKGFIEMCDSIGMYVGAEVSLGGAGSLMQEPSFIAQAMLRTVETVERDVNNPSIIYWSVGNEDAFSSLFQQCVRTVKALDPTRPVLLPWNADERLPEEIDILAPHYWTAAEYDSLAAQSSRPIITTEYVHAYGEQRFGGLADCWAALRRHPAAAGGAVWMWADQGIKTPHPQEQRNAKSIIGKDPCLRLSTDGWDGIVDSYRRPTRDYWEVKSVYMPVFPAVESLPFKNDTLRVAICNDYDFTNLKEVSIQWLLFVDGQQKDEGIVRAQAMPHTTGEISIPLHRLGKLEPGQTPYLWLIFNDKQGREIGRRSLELTRDDIPELSPRGKHSFAFDAKTGLPEGFRPTIWHKLNDGDEVIQPNEFSLDATPDHYTTQVLSKQEEQNEQGRVMRSRVAYSLMDGSLCMEADYVCTIDERGVMTIDYEIIPLLHTNYVPLIGMAVKLKSTNSFKHWFGLGPDEAYPNKRSSEMLGLWPAKSFSGTRAIRWVEMNDCRYICNGYIDRDSAESGEVRILSRVLGRSEKSRLKDAKYWLPNHKAYRGKITVVSL